jgi:hypothetical protein
MHEISVIDQMLSGQVGNPSTAMLSIEVQDHHLLASEELLFLRQVRAASGSRDWMRGR